ncbi:interferon-inducible double-stranded RNA-dependent protein kinase activator A [Aphis craccivora]|uniref:Interferon-inducible double-stranded RNA-dependent protein kinase activator A n=1 Tax=Aphis craccivora TaxID=307492 RepID=A0A6G0YFW1_APHCR|nr:interferon-inducible double-stranded RNA-dependent protein kinase activator A [Aphis craccivora]
MAKHSKIYTYNAKFREILTYGYGFSGYGVTNGAANTFLENLVSISEIDDYLNSTNPTLLVNNNELEKSNSYIETFLYRKCIDGPYESRALIKPRKSQKTFRLYVMLMNLGSNQLLSSKNKFVLKLNNYQEDCCEVTMSLKITTPIRPDLKNLV